jgi:hypothetical protein
LLLPDTRTRTETRILIICNLGERIIVRHDLMHSLADWLDTGRFEHHIKAAASLLPQVTDPVSIEESKVHFAIEQPGVRIRRIAAAIAITPRRDGLLILEIELGRDATANDVADFLYSTWRWRSAIRVGEIGLLDWLAARLGHVTSDSGGPLIFGQNVHQCVFAGGRLARRLLSGNKSPDRVSPSIISIVFRGTVAANRGSRLDIRRPPALNNPGETLVAHGRGVSLIAGWADPVENAFVTAAAGLVNAAGVVRRVRLESLEALRVNEASTATSPSEVRALISDLSDRLNQLQLDLSFGIEAYADVTLIPELLVESYHSSLRAVAGLADSLTNTSRIVDRVAAVISSRHAMLEASIQAYAERRDKIFATAIAIGSLLALPPTLLLAYFAVSTTTPHVSIFNLHRYGIAYLVVWLPFIALVAGALIMRRRIQPHIPEWHEKPDRPKPLTKIGG